MNMVNFDSKFKVGLVISNTIVFVSGEVQSMLSSPDFFLWTVLVHIYL